MSERLGVFVPFGVLSAIALGIVLIPLRELVSASNLAFVFLIWTMVVAELGGRGPALVTAVVSALSLNFFLTRPYLTLSIHDRQDVIAFVALAVTGLVGASFGRRRQASVAATREVKADLDAITRIARTLEPRGAAGSPLADVVREIQSVFRLRAVALRDVGGRIVARAGLEGVEPGGPMTALEPDSLLAPDETQHSFGRRGLRLPPGGGRVTLRHGDDRVGALDLWEGDPEGLDLDECKALSVIARLVAAQMPSPGRQA